MPAPHKDVTVHNFLSCVMTPEDFSAAGLHKLTIDDLLALTNWAIAYGARVMHRSEEAAANGMEPGRESSSLRERMKN